MEDGSEARAFLARTTEMVNRRLLGLAEGDLSDPATWRAVADQLGVAVRGVDEPGGPRSGYTVGALDHTGVVTINTSYPPAEQARALSWQLAQHLLYWAMKDAGLIGG